MTTQNKKRGNNREDNQTLENLLDQATKSMNTADALMDVYESIERSYRDAVLAGEVQPSIASTTNYR